jgi:outer membrane protein assembly factor BamB
MKRIQKYVSQEKTGTVRPFLNSISFVVIRYLIALVLLLFPLKPIKAADLPVPPFDRLWTIQIVGQVDKPTFCDRVIIFDTWPHLEAIEYGAVDLKTGEIHWQKSIEGYHILTKTYEKNRFFMVIEKDGSDRRKLTYTGRAEVLVIEPVSGNELLRIPIDEVGCDPVIKDSTLYCVFGDDVLKSIDLFTQKTLWSITIPGAHKNVESFPSPINRKQIKVAGMNLFVEDHNKAMCVNRQTGEVRWRYETDDEFWSIQADDSGEYIYHCSGRELRSVNPMNGGQKWAVSMKSDILWSPIQYSNLIFLVCRDRMLYALQADSGKVIWKYYLSSSKRPIFSKPFIQDNTIILSADFKLVSLFLSGIKLWEFDIEQDYLRDIVVLKDGYLLCFNNRISRYTTEKKSEVPSDTRYFY